MLEVKKISYSWDTSQRPYKGIRKVSFRIGPNETVGVLGKSGSGKSTLARCVSGLLDVQEGRVLWEGEKVPGPSEQLIPGHPDILMLNQDIHILQNHTVYENLNDRMTSVPLDSRQRKINQMLLLTGLKPFSGQKAGTLSQGQKQRLSLARSFILLPRLLVLDEPFNHLDYGWKTKLTAWLLEQQRKKHFSVLWITHDYDEIMKYCPRVICLHHGRKIAEGTPRELRLRLRSRLLSELFGPAVSPEENRQEFTLISSPASPAGLKNVF